jgi:putative membrane protein
MKIKIKTIIYYLTYIYLTFNFIVYINASVSKLIDYAYIALVSMFLLIYFLNSKNKSITKKTLTIPIILILFIFIQIIFGEFGFFDIFKNSVFAIIACLIFENNIFDNNNHDEKKKIDFIYVITCIYLIYFLILSFISGTLLAKNNSFFLLSMQDKNLSGVIIFLYMCFCYNKKYKLGVILCIIYTIFLNSRMTQIASLLFFGVEYLRNKLMFSKVLKLKLFSSMESKNIYFLIILSQIIMIGFSYYSTYNIPISQISKYQESLMDGSNAIRVRANVYAFETIKNDVKFIYRGYDSEIKNQLGVSDINNSTQFMGFRLVQPHNLFLNLALRYGLIYTFIYLMYISHLVSIYWNNKTFSCLLAYIFMNMTLHYLFSNGYLIFLLFALQPLVNNKLLIKKE